MYKLPLSKDGGWLPQLVFHILSNVFESFHDGSKNMYPRMSTFYFNNVSKCSNWCTINDITHHKITVSCSNILLSMLRTLKIKQNFPKASQPFRDVIMHRHIIKTTRLESFCSCSMNWWNPYTPLLLSRMARMGSFFVEDTPLWAIEKSEWLCHRAPLPQKTKWASVHGGKLSMLPPALVHC